VEVLALGWFWFGVGVLIGGGLFHGGEYGLESAESCVWCVVAFFGFSG